MAEKNIIQTILKNSTINNQKPNHQTPEKIDSEVHPTHINFEEAKVQSDLPLIDSHLESIKNPYGL